MNRNLRYSLLILSMGLTLPGLANADCDVDFNGEKLEIKCDGDPDTITVFVDGADELQVKATPAPFANLGDAADLKDIVIEADGGRDKVVIHNLAASGSIEIKTGGKKDTVTVRKVFAGNDLKIETGQGKDSLTLKNVHVSNSIDIKMGSGRDRMITKGAYVSAGNDFKAEGGSGKDRHIETTSPSASNVEIKDFEL